VNYTDLRMHGAMRLTGHNRLDTIKLISNNLSRESPNILIWDIPLCCGTVI